MSVEYTRWKWNVICQRPNTGSRWWRGNFTLGLHIDSHPRFVNVIFCLLVLEIGVGWKRDAIIPEPYTTVAGVPMSGVSGAALANDQLIGKIAKHLSKRVSLKEFMAALPRSGWVITEHGSIRRNGWCPIIVAHGVLRRPVDHLTPQVKSAADGKIDDRALIHHPDNIAALRNRLLLHCRP